MNNKIKSIDKVLNTVLVPKINERLKKGRISIEVFPTVDNNIYEVRIYTDNLYLSHMSLVRFGFLVIKICEYVITGEFSVRTIYVEGNYTDSAFFNSWDGVFHSLTYENIFNSFIEGVNEHG